jgi:hypothetical protein
MWDEIFFSKKKRASEAYKLLIKVNFINNTFINITWH